ncbi:MAG: EscU/YscU/HrcU family type III secretion system export apparatus switch protein [Janthinobacterium lividum]
MSGKTSEEKTLPPSRKKLADARRKGQVAGCRELVTAVGSTVVLAYVSLRGGALLADMERVLDDAGRLDAGAWDEAYPALLDHAARAGARFVLPLLALLVAAVATSAVVGHGGLVFSTDPLQPKMERISPTAGFGRILALRNATEAAKTVLKFAVLALTAAILLRAALNPLAELPACGLQCVPGLVRAVFGPLVVAAVLLFLVLGAADLGLQRFLFRRDQRMTRTEQKRERKDTQGNPLIRSAHRRERHEAMRSHVRIGVRNATFVVHGDTVAVALCYAPPDVLVPALVARAGNDAVQALLDEAHACGLPCVHDPETAAAVSSRVQTGGLIPDVLFAPVIRCMRQAGVL